MKRVRIPSGAVAFFDVMGFSQINKKNDIEDVARIIINYLDGLPKRIREERRSWFVEIGMDKHADRFARSISTILLSDSIFLLQKDSEADKSEDEVRLLKWYFFLLTCLKLMSMLLDDGLLLQGAIGDGRYFRKKTCFAGMPLVNSISMSSKMNLAGCVILPDVWDEIAAIPADEDLGRHISGLINSMTFEYVVPIKSSSWESYEAHRMLRFGTRDGDPQKIRKAFNSFNREDTAEIKHKIKNTIAMIDSLQKKKNEVV